MSQKNLLLKILNVIISMKSLKSKILVELPRVITMLIVLNNIHFTKKTRRVSGLNSVDDNDQS